MTKSGVQRCQRIASVKQHHCELCDCLVAADAYTPCCGKFLCARCARGAHCPVCQTPNVGKAHQAVATPGPAPDDWLDDGAILARCLWQRIMDAPSDYELRASGYDE